MNGNLALDLTTSLNPDLLSGHHLAFNLANNYGIQLLFLISYLYKIFSVNKENVAHRSTDLEILGILI